MRIEDEIMRRIALGLALSLFASAALAQTPAVPLGPSGAGAGGGGGGGSYTAAANGGLTLTGSALSLGDGVGISYASPGQLSLIGGTVTSNAPLLNLTETWNASGTTFNGIFENITNTNSSASSHLINLEVGGATVFSVNTAGGILAASSISAGVANLIGGSLILDASNNGVVYFGTALDTSLSRTSAGVFGIGTGAQGSFAGQLELSGNFYAKTTAPTVSSGFAWVGVVEGSSGSGYCSLEMITASVTQVIAANVPGAGC
jgi:hypothetical protein